LDIPINLTADELNFVMQVLGELPTKTGAYTVLLKIKQQADAAAITQAPITPFPAKE